MKNKWVSLPVWTSVQTYVRTHRINWTVGACIGISGVIMWYLHTYVLVWLMLVLLPYLIEKQRVIPQQSGTDTRPDRLTVSYLLSFLNPFSLWQTFLQLTGQWYLSLKYQQNYPDAVSYTPACIYSFPFEGEWWVANGGIETETSHSWEILTQRYAYDFVIQDTLGSTCTGTGNRLEDYYAYQQHVLSPADGTVVAVKGWVRDYKGVGSLSIDWATPDFRGNFVVIRHAPREYSFIAHLKKGSIRVRKGERVKRGQVLGVCGNSGHSTEPHIHFHVQTGASMWFSMGLPIQFSNFSMRTTGTQVTVREAEYVEKDCYVANV